MYRILLLLCFSVGLSANAAVVDTGKKSVIIDYPEALQKAGLKKIRCIFKDSRKLLWIGTENGLYRYDGTNIDLLEHEAGNLHTIPNNNIVSICEDKLGNLWAGTLQGAAKINAWTLQCAVYNSALHTLNDDFDLKMYCGADGRIWAGSSAGLSAFDPAGNSFKSIWKDRVKGESNSDYINHLAAWQNDTLLLATFHGIVLINKNNFGFRRVNPARANLTVTRLYVDAKKRIWMATWGNGLIVSDNTCTHFTSLAWEKPENQSIQNVVTCVISTHADHDSRLWVSTLKGVYQVKGDGDNPANCRFTAVSLNQNGFINNLYADDEEYIWESGASVVRFFAGDGIFSALPLPVSGAAQHIQPMRFQNRNALAVSSWYKNSGLLIGDLSGKIIYRQPAQSNQDASNISGIAVDKFHRIWTSALSGISVLDSHFRQVDTKGVFLSGTDKLPSSKTNGILISRDTVWVACYRRGVVLYDLRFHRLKTFSPGDDSGLADNLINGFYADAKGTVWVLGDYNLYRYDQRQGRFNAYNFNNDATHFSVNAMAALPNGDLLVASSSGLYQFNPETGARARIFSPLLSREKAVQSVCVDQHNDIWFTNNDQLIYYQRASRHFTLFGKEDGLNEDDEAKLLTTFDGKTMFLTEGAGVLTFSAVQNTATQQPVRLYLHALQVNDSTVSRILLADMLKLKYNQNKLNVEFGAINYIKPEQNLYAYRLSKVDTRWVTTTRNFASYANLAPGRYTFTVKAENYAGLWSRPLKLQIIISPPFWATWWFRLVSGLFILSVLFFVIRYVAQRNLREKILRLEKEKAIEQERNRIARDMHDDLGSGLTKIAVMSEVTKARLNNHNSAAEYLDVISTASRELVDNLQDIIWVLNPQNDSVESLALYLKEYTAGFFEHTTVTLQFNYDDGFGHLSLSEEKRRNIFLVVKESCNNILKHAGDASVMIDLNVEGGFLLLEIKDDGCGFDTASIALFSNGLQNMKNRMQQIDGEFRLRSAPGQGTSIRCIIRV